MIKQLLSISSISGHEMAIQKLIAKYLKCLGFKPIMIEGSIVVHIRGKNHTTALIFNSHVDTVSSGDLTQWEYDPYKATLVGDRVYGLGASDEKSAVAVLLLLAEKYAKNKPPCDIFLMFVVREEMDGSGTAKVMQWSGSNLKNRYQAVAGILGEPTDLNTIEVGHKGNIFFKLTTAGDSGHGSRPEKIKQHAILKMYQVTRVLEGLGKAWKVEYTDKILGKPTIGLLTAIQSGDIKSPNKFPDSCVATFDIRTTPALHSKALAIITEKIGSLAKIETTYDPVSYGLTDSNETIVKIFKKETKAKISVSEGSNDMCFFTKFGIPAVIFGPGVKSAIHKPNEYCYLANIRKCLSIYNKIIQRFADYVSN